MVMLGMALFSHQLTTIWWW